jgi:Cytochrome c554 and c-prime
LRATLLIGGLLIGGLASAAETPKYTGPGSCASPSCHGGVQPRADSSVWQNEYSTWVIKDKHAQAYSVLSNPVATRMAKILGLPSATTAPKCLACHALDVPEDQRARTFDLTDGVSCESCHGPASNWLGLHTTKGWTHQQSIDAGMFDDRDLIHRSERCLTCHLGTREKSVDHEMIAAGHPDLYFELASFSAVMPRHWNEHFDKDPWIEVRTLATGQAVQLREQLRRVARNAQGTVWPEYAELDCFACHHSLTAPLDSWRQAQGYAGRRSGNPPWNLSRYAVLRVIINEADRSSAQQLEAGVNKLYALVSSLNADRAAITAQANATAEIADRLAQRLNAAQFDGPLTMRLMKSITAAADSISAQGERAAEQAAMALDSLLVASTRNSKIENADLLRNAIHALFKELDDPSSFNAPKFAQQLRAVGDALK